MDERFVLVAESSSSQAGRWKTLPYQRGIADALTDPEIEQVSILKSARVGYTKLLVGYICYRIEQDPCSILAVQPGLDDVRKFSKREIAPAFAAVVPHLVAPPRSRDSTNTIEDKSYPGGFLRIVGAHSGLGFRGSTVDVAIFDEVDGYPPSAGQDGDPVDLGKKRTASADFPKHILGSTPKIKGSSRIVAAYEESDRRVRLVPCPHCDHGQELRFGGREFDYGLKWPEGRPEEAAYLCEHCHCLIDASEQPNLDARGEWSATRPEVKHHAGFRIWAAYSPFPSASWGAIAAEFLQVKDDPPRLQVFSNTVLGEAWEIRGRAPREAALMKRREPYPTRETGRRDGDEAEREAMVPEGVVVLTSGTDVQPDRLEVQVEGWGIGEENWKLEYHVLHGDPTAEPLWEEFWELITRPRYCARGGVDYVRSSCIDSGYATQSVYAFVKPRSTYRTFDRKLAFLWAIKGRSGSGKVWPQKPSKNTDVPVYTVMVDAAKDVIYGRTEKVVTPGPAFIHFPLSFGEDYFRQFTAEHAQETRNKRGFPVRVYELKKGRQRNEALDTSVYAYAALCALYSKGLDLDVEAKRIAAAGPTEPPSPSLEATHRAGDAGTPAPPSAPRRARRKWKSARL